VDGTKVAIAFEQKVDVLETSDGRIKTLANLREPQSTPECFFPLVTDAKLSEEQAKEN
jgi:hypothetical protein